MLRKLSHISYNEDIALFQQVRDYHSFGPLRVDFFVLLVCLKGHGTLNISGVDYRLDAGQMFVCKPHIIIEKSSASLDFECRGMALSRNFIEQIGSLSDGGWDVGLFLSKNPVVPLSADEVGLFVQYYDLLQSKISRQPCRHQDEVMQALFRAFMLEFFDLMDRFVNVVPPKFTSAEMLFKRFLDTLMSTYPKPRSVEWYADKLCVTPKYLSAVSKSVSGITASEVINRSITDDIKRLLRTPGKSIKEIANELDFPNLSFFGKYVKRMLGQSPKAYRKAMGLMPMPANDASQYASGLDAERAG